jgi:hypothetical protein
MAISQGLEDSGTKLLDRRKGATLAFASERAAKTKHIVSHTRDDRATPSSLQDHR